MTKTAKTKDENSYDFYFWIGAEAEQLDSLEKEEFNARIRQEAARTASGGKPLPKV